MSWCFIHVLDVMDGDGFLVFTDEYDFGGE